MMDILLMIAFGVFSYLLGSIPTSVWYGRRFHNTDVRDYGSGNAGATNTFRVLGKKAGALVLMIDALKGWVSASFGTLLFYFEMLPFKQMLYFQLLYGCIAVTGHILPIFAKFKGGKGVATLLGVVLAIYLEVALLSLLIFVVVFLVSHYVSLGSMTAALSFPTLMLIPALKPQNDALIVVGFVLAVLVLWTHRKNIQRLLSGNEGKIYVISKKIS